MCTRKGITFELRRLSAWLQQLRITHVAMEATGVYWEPVGNVLVGIGLDASPFGDAQRLSSWAGVCPGNYQTGAKRQRGTAREPRA